MSAACGRQPLAPTVRSREVRPFSHDGVAHRRAWGGMVLRALHRRRCAATACWAYASSSVCPAVPRCHRLCGGVRVACASCERLHVCGPGAAWGVADQREWDREEDRTRPRGGVVDHFRRGGISRSSSRHCQLLPPSRANAGARSNRRPHPHVASCPYHRMARSSPSAGRWRATDWERRIARCLRSATVIFER